MSYTNEFATVDLLIESKHETRAVDAFALSLIKSERQMRRLVTHLVYQFPCFQEGDGERLRDILAKSGSVYFDGLEAGFNALYSHSVEQLLGAQYVVLRKRLQDAGRQRNKIFHGQLTSEYLSRQELLSYICDIRSWCHTLGESTQSRFQYDGFGRNAYQKSPVPDLSLQFKIQMKDLNDFKKFVASQMERSSVARTKKPPASKP